MLQVLKKAALAFFCALAILVAGMCLLIALSIPSQHRKEREDERAMAPSISWVKNFEKKRGRLPTNEEFLSQAGGQKHGMWLDTNGFYNCPEKPTTNVSSPPFCVQMWRGEDAMHYHSWNGKYLIVDPPNR